MFDHRFETMGIFDGVNPFRLKRDWDRVGETCQNRLFDG